MEADFILYDIGNNCQRKSRYMFNTDTFVFQLAVAQQGIVTGIQLADMKHWSFMSLETPYCLFKPCCHLVSAPIAGTHGLVVVPQPGLGQMIKVKQRVGTKQNDAG